MYKIGEFSKLVNISPRMLRHYDEQGIFSPSSIDPVNGYRLHSLDQIARRNQILLLRDSGFKVSEINKTLERMIHSFWNRFWRKRKHNFAQQLLQKKKS